MEKQNEAIAYFIKALSSLNGVKALFLKGSLARGAGDEWSDVDLYCLVEEEFTSQFMQIRETVIRGFLPVILYEEVNFGKPQLIAIYDNHLHVDLYMTTDLPDVAFEPIRSLYDPQGILPAPLPQSRNSFEIEVIDYLNNAIYTFHELDIAIQRGDFIWAQRLGSHILADLSLALCNQCNTTLPILHIKGLTHKLPTHLQAQFQEASSLLGNGTWSDAIQKLLELTEAVISDQNTTIKTQLRLTFFDAFKSLKSFKGFNSFETPH